MPTNTIKIIDPHVHLWDLRNTPKEISPLVKAFGWSPWLLDKMTRLLMPSPLVDFVGLSDHVLKDHLPEIFHRDTGKYDVAGYVHIQAGWEGKKPTDLAGETAWLQSLNDKPMAIIGEARLSDLDHLDAVLDAHQEASPLFRGVRDMVAQHPAKGVHNWCHSNNLLTSDNFKKGFQRLGERGLTFDTFLYSNQLEDFARLTKDVPHTKVVLDHVGSPVALVNPYGGAGLNAEERKEIKEKWYEGLSIVAQNEQVHMKLSGLFMPILGFNFHQRKEAPALAEVVEAMEPHIKFAIDTFGVDRCMFASNFPMDKVSLSYELLYDAYFEIVKDFSESDQEKLFSGNAMDFYGINH